MRGHLFWEDTFKSILGWPIKTGFTVCPKIVLLSTNGYDFGVVDIDLMWINDDVGYPIFLSAHFSIVPFWYNNKDNIHTLGIPYVTRWERSYGISICVVLIWPPYIMGNYYKMRLSADRFGWLPHHVSLFFCF